jgi:hypothetical protein
MHVDRQVDRARAGAEYPHSLGDFAAFIHDDIDANAIAVLPISYDCMDYDDFAAAPPKPRAVPTGPNRRTSRSLGVCIICVRVHPASVPMATSVKT